MKQLAFAAALLLGVAAHAQTRYTTSGGFLVGPNFYQFLVDGDVPDDYAFKLKNGYDFGGWVNVPVGRVLSVEAQPMYSSRKFYPEDADNPYNEPKLKMGFFSLPVLLKGHIGRKFALFAGPQFDFRTNVADDDFNSRKQDYEKFSIGLTGGLEFFPRDIVTVYARYHYGFTDMYVADGENDGDLGLNMSGIHVGLKFRLAGGEVVGAAATTMPFDTDGDGVTDVYDMCPNTPGPATMEGCPDSDKDGIPDHRDACPNAYGSAAMNGCPDTDGDGVADNEDRCPELPGIPDNRGCLEMEYYFKSAESTLSADDKANLDKAAEFLSRYPNLTAVVEGHTSTDGEADFNQRLSEQRAQNSVDYLVSKGINRSRISAKGYGEQFPVGDNSTEEGKSKSRRVVVRIQ